MRRVARGGLVGCVPMYVEVSLAAVGYARICKECSSRRSFRTKLSWSLYKCINDRERPEAHLNDKRSGFAVMNELRFGKRNFETSMMTSLSAVR